MKAHFLLGLSLFTCFFLSCESPRKSTFPIVDYNKKLFSNGEYTTLLSKYTICNPVIDDSVKSGYSLLCGNVYVRDALQELFDGESSEKFDMFNYCGGWPHLIIPSLGIDLQILNGSFCLTLPEGAYDVILIAEEYYPIHLFKEFNSQHKYSIDFYLGCTVIH